MEMTANTQRKEALGDQVGHFGNSHLRMTRFQWMKRYLEREDLYILYEYADPMFAAWTREQIEQALEDVIKLGYGKVWGMDDDGTIKVQFIEKEEQ